MPGFIVGVGRGGLAPGVYLSHRLDVPMLSVDHSSRVFGFADALLINLARRSAAGEQLLFIDDINDSGGTIHYLREALAREGAAAGAVRFATLIDNSRSSERVDYASRVIDRAENRDWFVFPWEAMASRATLVEEAESVPERLGRE
ncbi:phosphoribosyltransferase domain-containing protein [Sphingomonas sp. XMGL2]|uniref:Phosphoribosyltransferase domain-containing protein n=2 Tax=Sphingomonas quercus TaxID=2842451 RepID=A0ABS6BJH8_9SPHN|nr:phosphoribosyltransferase domain-containing protein [Sphingomonas quercus]